MYRYVHGLFACAALGLLAAGVVQAGVVIHSTSKDLTSGRQTDHNTVYVQNGLMRIDNLDKHGQLKSFTLFRDNAIWDARVDSHTYVKMDRTAMQQGAQRMNADMEKLKAQMANLPPERRAMVEQMMKRMHGVATGTVPLAQVTWTNTGRRESVGSYTCRIWESRTGGNLTAQYCVVPTGRLPGGQEIAQSMRSVSRMVKEMMSAFPPAARAASQRLAGFEAFHGYPVMVRQFEDGKPSSEDVVVDIREQTLPESEFEMPSGFTERQPFRD